MYLMIFEDGEINSAEGVSDDDLRAVDDGGGLSSSTSANHSLRALHRRRLA